jgi:2-succinyl-5-enolpyruvyl-6-hydroxy-3-cyclohexene-1-carboxylate synthase
LKKKINESTGTLGSPGTKGYTGYLPSEKYAKYRSDLARIIKKTTGYELVELEPIVDDTIDVKDNETNDDDISDVNISSPERHKQLQKDFKKMNESIGRKVTVKEVIKWMKKLEEYRYRKVKNVDARRVTSFINNGLNETDLPQSLQKKWEHAKYGKEKHLADRFIKQQIQNKLMTSEEKMPKLKELLSDIE